MIIDFKGTRDVLGLIRVGESNNGFLHRSFDKTFYGDIKLIFFISVLRTILKLQRREIGRLDFRRFLASGERSSPSLGRSASFPSSAGYRA